LLLVLLSAALHAQRAAPSKVEQGNSKQPNQLIPEEKIPVVQLGFLPPGNLPAFYYYAMVELHYIDADHLLFAFNTPGLLKRDDNCPDSDVQRLVHTVVFQLPGGKVLKQMDWKLYDFMDFLWGIGDGKLLLRRCNRLESIGADLDPQVLVQAGGKVEDVSLSPDRSTVVIQEKVKPDANDKDNGAIPSVLASGTEADRTMVSFIHLNPLRLIGHAEIESPSAIPLIANGLIEVLTAPNDQWVVNLRPFQGKERQVASIHSLCPPLVHAISNTIFMARTCAKGDKDAFEGYDLQGSLLWQIPLASEQFYPRLIPIPNSSHFAIESLRLRHPRAALDPLTKEDVVGEDIDIYDTLSGGRVATFQTSPSYTGGQNVDFSPDGTRMAVLHDGAIEIYSLSDLIKAPPGIAH
jgi:hypothetical protein